MTYDEIVDMMEQYISCLRQSGIPVQRKGHAPEAARAPAVTPHTPSERAGEGWA